MFLKDLDGLVDVAIDGVEVFSGFISLPDPRAGTRQYNSTVVLTRQTTPHTSGRKWTLRLTQPISHAQCLIAANYRHSSFSEVVI